MQLNYQLRVKNNTKKTIPIIIIHGLFGSLSNFGTIASFLSINNYVVQVDLRNHGNSPHTQSMTYIEMAQDIVELLDKLLIEKCIIIGHSMGGKVAMMVCMLHSQRVSKLIVIDIAPTRYDMRKHNNIFNAIEYINRYEVKEKTEAAQLMQQYISDKLLIAFLLKSFYKGLWKFCFSSIKNNYYNISDWCMYFPWWGPALFIKGELSLYININNIGDIYHQFPRTYIYNIPNAGHWAHYDNPKYVYDIIKKFVFYEYL